MRSRYCFLALVILMGLGSGLGAYSQGKRVALLIGNSAYSSGRLANPVNDATDMAVALKSIGFTVLLGTDANRKAMYDLVDEFGGDIQGADIALFYYSGCRSELPHTRWR